MNHRPNAVQKRVSFARLRILYDRTTDAGDGHVSSTKGGDVRWRRERRSGASNAGK